MIINFYPFISTMIEQCEVITIVDNKLFFKRTYGPEIVEDTFELDDDMLNKINNLFIEEKQLIECQDVIDVDGIKFNYVNSSLTYKELSTLLTNKLNFKYNPRAFFNENVLFYLFDYKKYYEFHYYQEALDYINKFDIKLFNNECIVDNKLIKIELDHYKVLSFNTTNKLHQVIITTLVFNRYNN